MFMGLGMPIPDLSNKPGPGRPGWGPAGSYDFQFEVIGDITIEAFPNTDGESFTIKWQDGTTTQTSGSSTINSPAGAGAGIVSINNELDNTYADEFKIVSGQANVTKVISWGQNPWSIVEEAFKDCVNLTDISTTSFIAGTANESNQASGCIMGKMFLGCTSLLEVDIRTWDLSTNGASWRLGGPFANLANLQKLDATGLKIKFFDANNVSTSNFANIGTNVADGCEFKMAGLDLSTSSTGYLDSLFAGTKFKGGSNLSNWKFPVNFNPAGWRGYDWFSNCILNDGILDISGWTTWPGLNVPGFGSFNSALTSQGTARIDLSNLGLTNASDFSYMFYVCKIKEIIGLNTWGACAGNANMFRMFMNSTLMRINPNDNFSDTFIASLSPTNLSNAFNGFGNGLLDAERGVAMNFNNIDFSNAPSFDSTWRSAKLLDAPNFSTATFDNNNTISFPTTFRSFNALNSDSSFVLNGGKVTNFGSAFYGATINTVNINDGVDLSALTSVSAMFYYSGVGTATLPSDANYSSLTNFSIWTSNFSGFSVCQGDILMRRLKATNLNTNITATLPKITESPALVNSNRDVLENDRSWNITTATPDATLPFAYASYFVDPTGITTISPTTTPPAGSVFTATNGLSISASGIITIGSFRGGSTIRCTYPDGCYNEVVMLIQVPFKMTIEVPNGGIDLAVNHAVTSDGEYAVDWGDGVNEIVSGNKTHTWSNSTGSTITREMSFFDSPGGSVFRGFSNWIYNTYLFAITPTTSTARRLRITQWGEIKWNSAGQFQNLHDLDVLATDAPDLSETTTLAYWFSQNNKKRNPIFTNANDSLSTWNVSTITDMNSTFWNLRAYQGDLSSWDVSNVTNMARLFASNSNYQVNAISCNVNGWDTSSVTNLNSMFFQNNGNTGVEAELGRNAILTYGYPAEHQLTSNITGATDGVYTGITATNISYSPSGQVIPTFEITVQGGTIVKARPDQYVFSNRNNASNIIQFDTSSMGGTGNGQITLYGRWRNELPGNTNTQRDLSNWKTSLVTNFSSMFYTGYAGLTNFNTKMVNGTLRWDIAAATSFSNWWYNSGGPSSSANWPSNWKLPTGTSLGNFAHRGMNNADVDSFSTKTVNETWYGGTSYTAWDVSTVTSFANAFNYGNLQSVKNYNIGTWNVTSSATNIANLLMTDINGYGSQPVFDQDLGHWDVTNVTAFGANWLGNRRATLTSGNLSTANLDSIYDITNGWGQDAASVQSGVTIGFGTSQYSPGNLYYGSQGANTYQTNKIYNGGADLRLFTSIGDVVERSVDPNGAFDTYAIITGYDANGQRATTQGNIGPADYTVMDSDAAKGRVALINAGWTITDGGAYIPFDSVEMTINVSSGDTFSITPQGSPNNFKVDWGDGNGFVGDPNNGGANYTGSGFTATSPAYASSGNKTVKICEDSSQYIHSLSQNYNGPSAGDRSKIININHWGTNTWKTFYRTFFGCNNLVLNTTTTPNLANGPSMAGMFQTSGADFTNSNIGNWDMSAITDVTSMFQQTSMNVDISGWNTGNITTMLGLFYNNSTFNQDISNWDTSNVTSLYVTFSGASSLNADLNTKDTGSRLAWDVSNVTSFQGALSGTTSMTYDIDKWQITTDASKTVTMANMFTGNINWMSMEPKTVTVGSGAYQKTYLAWDTQRVTSLSETFHANNAFNKDIGKWDTSSVTNMYRTFRYATAFNNGGQPMNTRSVTAGTGATARTYNAWDVSNVTIFERGPFENNQAFNQDVSNWDVSNAANALVRGFENAQVFDHYLPWDLNTSANPPSTYYLYNMFNNSGMSTNNYTDTIVYWANFVKNQTPDAPLNVGMNAQGGRTYDTTRTATGFTPATAGRARSFLTLDVTVSGGTGVNGVYYYDYANDKWVKETDSTYVIEWNGDESSWELKYEGSVVNAGSGGTQTGGPESSTSWSGGLTVVDSSKGWTITSDTITT